VSTESPAAETTPKVPAEAQAALQTVVESGQAQWYLSGGEKIEFTALGFCTWYMAERQRIREQVATEIEALREAEDRMVTGNEDIALGLDRAARSARGEAQ
jgi:hypothetical protein